MLHLGHHLLPRLSLFPFPPRLLFPRTKSSLFERLVIILDGDVHLLDSCHVLREIVLKASRHKRPRRISSGKEMIPAARPVDARVGRDVEDGAVDGEVDW